MPYFPVDDKLHSHRKAIKAGLAAMGLWVMAGSWSNDHGTDGFIPDYIAARFSPDYEDLAARLVTVRLWEAAEVDDEKGWAFHEWTGDGTVKRNYTRAEVEHKRRDWAERQAKSRERRANVTRDTRVTPTVTDPVTHADVKGESRGSHGVPVPVPVPVPVSSSSKSGGVDLSALPGGKIPDTLAEEDKPASMRSPLDAVRCPEHVQPKIGNCVHCKREHGIARWYADPAHWSERDRTSAARDFDRVKAWAER